MDKYPPVRKDLAIGIILLFVNSKSLTSYKTKKVEAAQEPFLKK